MKLTKSLMPEGASVQCKGFLFDLDGTLVDSLPAVYEHRHKIVHLLAAT